MESLPALVVEHLTIALGKEQVAVQDLNFSIAPGKTLAIVGESDSGKSLVALALMGLLPKAPTWTGTIHLNAAHITSDTAPQLWHSIRGRVAAMLFREPMNALNPLMKVGHQLEEAIRIHAGLSGLDARAAAMEWLRKVHIPAPEKSYHKYPHQLSDGQKQRLMIAMAMSANPALLIADEPTATLDPTVQAELIQLMRGLQHEAGAAMIFITNNLRLAATVADEVLLLRNGAVMEYGPAHQLLTDPKHPYTKALLACRPDGAKKGYLLPLVDDYMLTDGHPPALARQKAPHPTENVLLKVRHLRVWFPLERDWLGIPVHFLRAVEDVSFDLHQGEVLGILGDSGGGKSTIARALMGLEPVESGQMFFEANDLVHMDKGGWRRIRRDIQLISEDACSSLDPRLTVGEAVMEPLRAHRMVPRKELRKEAERLMQVLHLPAEVLQRYPHQLDEGQRLRIAIARAIALRPKLLICDECVSAMDLSLQAQILNLLKELQAELKLSLLFISRELNAIYYMADRVLIMQGGKIIERGTADEIRKRPQEPFTRKLVSASVL